MQFPELVVLATGTRAQESAVVSLVGKGRIYRFLHKPVSPARAGLFLGTATRRYLESRGTIDSRPLNSVKQLASQRPGKTVLVSLAVLLLTFAGIVAFMTLQKRATNTSAVNKTAPSQPVPREPVAPPQEDTPRSTSPSFDTAGMLSRYLSVAQGAYSAGRLISPPGDNALEYYRSALRLQENSAEALLGIERITTTLQLRVTTALQDGDAAAAAAALDAFQQAQPDAPQLEALRASVAALNKPAPPAVAQRNPAPAAPVPQAQAAPPPVAAVAAKPNPNLSKVSANIEQARLRIRNGQLTEPANNSALFFLKQALDAGEDSSVLKIAATDLGSRLLDGVRSARTANQPEQAQQLLDAARQLDRQFGLDLPDLDTVIAENRRFAAARAEQARLQRLASAVQLRESGQLLEPPGASAYDLTSALVADYPSAEDVRTERQRLASALAAGGTAAIAGGNRQRAQVFLDRASALVPELAEVKALSQQLAAVAQQPALVPARNLTRIRQVAPKYPRSAEVSGIEGTVDVEFTVATDGTTRDLVVRDSTPKRIFDGAAIEAVSQWLFKPVVNNGEPVAVRTVIKVRFSAKD
jgi:protein TonB